MKETVILFKLNEDGSEDRVPGEFASDADALKAVTKPGKYIFYNVRAVSKEDIANLKSQD
jgi:hypothetical protein